MTIQVKTMLKASPTGDQALFYDVTGTAGDSAYSVGSNLGYADVTAIRIKISTYTTLAGVDTINEGDSFVQYKEYVKTEGSSSTIDDKNNLIIGSTIVARLDSLIVPVGDVWQETGYYVYPWISTWLPQSSQVQLNMDLSTLNQIDSVIEDNIYAYTYEIYTQEESSTFAAVIGREYLVQSGSAIYAGSTYYEGDIFVGEDISNVVIGTGVVSRIASSIDSYASIDYSKRLSIYNKVTLNSARPNEKCFLKLSMLDMYLDAASFMCETGNVAIGPSKAMLDFVDFSLQNMSSCNN